MPSSSIRASLITMILLGDAAFLERRYQEASRWTDSALTIDPGFHDGYAMRGLFRFYLGDSAGARADAETALRIAPGEPSFEQTVLALLDVRAGDTLAARVRVNRLLTEAGDRADLNLFYGRHAAAALVALGDHERALEVLERIRPRSGRLGFFLRSPNSTRCAPIHASSASSRSRAHDDDRSGRRRASGGLASWALAGAWFLPHGATSGTGAPRPREERHRRTDAVRFTVGGRTPAQRGDPFEEAR